MENIFKIAKYEATETGFKHIGYDDYKITYHKGKKSHQIRIVVDGIITNRVINLIDGNSGYKNQILLAISDVKNAKINLTQKQSEKKKVTLRYIETFYNTVRRHKHLNNLTILESYQSLNNQLKQAA